MTTSVSFSSTTPRFELPLIYAGQSQKEVCVDEALSLVDAMMHCIIEGQSTTPPASPVAGTNWLVSPSATGAWAGQDNNLACYQSGNWIFVSPRDGMLILNRPTGQQWRYLGSWQVAALPAAPTGGTTVDSAARSAISALISALQTAGVLPAS